MTVIGWVRAFRDIGLGYSALDRLCILWLTGGKRRAYWPMPNNQILIQLSLSRGSE